MSSGHRGTEAASPTAVFNALSANPGLRYFVRDLMGSGSAYHTVSRKYLVPYGAGRSQDGDQTYIDQNVPQRFKCGIEPDKYVSAHEGMEWWMMTRKDKRYWQGDGKGSAHWWATGFEHYLLRLDGYSEADIEEYEKEWALYIGEDEAERIAPDTVPPDLYTGPYEEGEDNDPGEEEISAKILPKLKQARALVVPVRNVGDGGMILRDMMGADVMRTR